MSIFNPSGGSAKHTGGAVAGNGTTANHLLDSIKAGQTSDFVDNDAKPHDGVSTITRTGSGNVTHLSNVGGYVALRFSGSVAAGETVYINNTQPLIAGDHYVTRLSGLYRVTDQPYESCMSVLTGSGAPNPISTYTKNSGTLDPDDQPVIVQGAGNDYFCGNSLTIGTCKSFTQYQSTVYTNCWQCFTGPAVSECDKTTSTITLWDDHACTPSVSYNGGGKVRTDNREPGANADQPNS
jgi:hypothetical protein